MNFIKRDRIIATRVSQEEFEELQRTSREQGAQSVSDFVRRIITNHKPAMLAAEAHAMALQIASLEQKVDWLTHMVQQSPPLDAVTAERVAARSPDGPRPAGWRSSAANGE